MPKHGKTYESDCEKAEPGRRYSLREALGVLKEFDGRKFDQTVDAAVRLNVDPRKADQMVRGTVVLPHGTGRSRTVLVFAKGDAAAAAEAAGADYVGAEDLVEKVQAGWTDFDVAIATPDMMGLVGRLGRILGPRGLMPNPKTGTVTPDPTAAVADAKAGKINFRVDRGGNVHAPLGLLSFEVDALYANAHAYFDAIQRARPTTIKGQYVKSITLSGTMTPGVRVDRSDIQSIST